MNAIEGILFEPVGCLAEFPAEPFNEIAERLYGLGSKETGSQAYWSLVTRMLESDAAVHSNTAMETLELQAVAGANIYDDVVPALSELKSMAIRLVIVTSLSNTAVLQFLSKGGLEGLFDGVYSRDTNAAPLSSALKSIALPSERMVYLTDAAEGLKVARTAGVQSILMMNDPDEAKRLTMADTTERPAGGIVSLHELPDLVRFVAARRAPLDSRLHAFAADNHNEGK
jgi:phosphoglycolate phosphatase-like HAD superfamily hydrolase